MSLKEFITTFYEKELKTKGYFCINACLTMSHQNHFDYANLSKPPNAKT